MRAEDRVLRVIGVITHIQMSDSIVYKQKIALLFFHHCLLKQLQEAISPLTGWYFQRSLSTTPFDNKKALHLFFFFSKIDSVWAQLHPTLWVPMDCSPPGSSVCGVFQARILRVVAISYSRGSSKPRDRTCVSHIPCTGRQVLYH